MGALAAMLKDQGHTVTGSDENVYPPVSDFLAARGIEIFEGYSPGHVDRAGPDLVIVGNVARPQNPEAVRTVESGLRYTSLARTLGERFIAGRESVVAAGTHGKTTTTALLAWMLERAGADPSFLAGGLCRNFDSNYSLGRGDHFVIEGDEYDTAYFDKVPKFIHYRPKWTILTGVEFDHADIYPDLEAVKEAFRMLIRLIPAQGRLMVFSGCATALDLAAGAACPVLRYGFRPGDATRAGEIVPGEGQVSFRLFHQGRDLGIFTSPLPGRHNLANALAALGLLLEMGFEPETLALGLRSFLGVRRRQEIIGEVGGVLVVDDFAHHPTAVRETLAALKEFYPRRRLIALFEPRSNTSRRNFFQEEYASSFDSADLVVIRESTRDTGLADEERLSCPRLVSDLEAKGIQAFFFPETEPILELLEKEARSGDLIAVMSNGGFDNIHRRILKRLTGKREKEGRPDGMPEGNQS